ncbi:hypothetical protein [Glycomyces niveus]|uniref:CopG family transcriptional regulator n=1 Tax=Glycomyces niveus TaxID=2820287 RepID=A0ABS3U8S1_9ACTN|nr:hypothetical protein [Glycomyces sp. NEAU-S30]MBO3735179.1 hypothetical protein [Glycomyces sp. NEAU-S30]
MLQTTVYLRDEQVAALKETAARLGRTEADLHREAVDLVLAQHDTPMGVCEMPTASAGRPLAAQTDDLLKGFGADR